jgi:DNA-binding response OmpR family regulator
MRILIVEDNQHLVANLFDYLEPRGHTLDAAPDGPTGLHLAMQHNYDVVILDWMLPRMDGPDVLRRLRQEAKSNVPVIMLTARNELPDKITGFRAGADDYLTKPFALAELEVRLEALAVRGVGRPFAAASIEIADLRLDSATLEVTRAGRLLHLYPACLKLLRILMQASPAAVTREQLEHAVWGDNPPSSDMLRSHMHDLRKAVDDPFDQKLIHTLPRVGYRIAMAKGSFDGD